jgi:uncharacterized membrane protein YGL010W
MNTTIAEPAGRPIDQLLDQYADSHRNHRNELIHFICVPAIVWSLLGVLWALHPLAALAAAAAAQLYYFRLSAPFAIGMALMSAVFLASLAMLPPGWVLPLAGGVFVVAWIGQFIGHKIEGKKPSFFDDLRFLLIGPLFVLGFLYRRLHVHY